MTRATAILIAGAVLAACSSKDEPDKTKQPAQPTDATAKTATPPASTYPPLVIESATVALLETMRKPMGKPLSVLLFYPQVSRGKQLVRDYLDRLARRAKRSLDVFAHEPVVAPHLARRFRVRKSGTVVVLLGDRHYAIHLGTDVAAKTYRGSWFDTALRKGLQLLTRAARSACLSVGHGELNALPAGSKHTSLATGLVKGLQTLDFRTVDWNGTTGAPVPHSCTILFVLAPATELRTTELDAIDRYLGRGGSLFLTLDPAIVSVHGFRGAKGSATNLGALSGRLGLAYEPRPVLDRPMGVMRLGSQRLRVMGTRQFGTHPAVAGLRRIRGGMPLLVTGSFTNAPFAAPSSGAKRQPLIQSEATAWVDLNANRNYDPGVERRQKHNIAVAIQGPRFRAIVLADADIISDLLLRQAPAFVSQLLRDAITWLGGPVGLISDP